MSQRDESGEEAIDDSGRNPTQQQIDAEGASDEPVDVDWVEDDDAEEDEAQ